MCTAITIQTPQGETYLGRTMDFSYPLDLELYVIPKGFLWNGIADNRKLESLYSVMGIGQDISPVVLADGVNEMGLSAAALYFPGYACYDAIIPQDSYHLPVAAVELVKFLLTQCASVSQAVSVLHSIRIVGTKDPVTGSVAPLHWILADQSGKCIVIEKTEDGMHLLNNPIGALTNSPNFLWHMTNLRNYLNVTPDQQPDREWGSVKLTPFGQGTGTLSLPGDYTPPSRFVRTAYLKTHTAIPIDRKGAVAACFHILESVSIPKDAVMTDRGTADYTQYTVLMNLFTKECFFKTYANPQISAARMPISNVSRYEVLSLGKLTSPLQFDYRTI